MLIGKANLPHYHLVPKERGANLRYRKDILERCGRNGKFAAHVKQMCAEDILYYINVFCWTYDPRLIDQGLSPKCPFITYEFQDEAIVDIVDCIQTGRDFAVPKSRDMGASWMGLAVYEWFWHFKDYLSFLLISRNQDYVDKAGNPKALFWKIDFIHKNQPRWLLPTGRHLGARDPNRKLLHMANADTHSVIDGESTTENAGVGDRRTSIFVDEFAAFDLAAGYAVSRGTRDVTNCRGFNSTPRGQNAFYDIIKKTSAKVIWMHWTRHPDKARGLYTSEKDENGNYRLQLVDQAYRAEVEVFKKGEKEGTIYQFPDDYPYILDGKQRSPWYDCQCSRAASAQEIAQELDIDFLGSGHQFFDPAFVKGYTEAYAQHPTFKGDLEFTETSLNPLGFRPHSDGKMHLWFSAPWKGDGMIGSFPCLDERKFGVSCDVSFGTGASNSACSVADLATGEKVALWIDPNTLPAAFADIAIAIAKFFNGAKMVWDASGPSGKLFTMQVVERGYAHVYYRETDERFRKTVSASPGVFLNSTERAVVLREYRRALEEHRLINRSKSGLEEMLQFVTQSGGKVEHSAALASADPAGAREAHGDEVIADALLVRLLPRATSSSILKSVQKAQAVPYLSPAWRIREEQREQRMSRVEADW